MDIPADVFTSRALSFLTDKHKIRLFTCSISLPLILHTSRKRQQNKKKHTFWFLLVSVFWWRMYCQQVQNFHPAHKAMESGQQSGRYQTFSKQPRDGVHLQSVNKDPWRSARSFHVLGKNNWRVTRMSLHYTVGTSDQTGKGKKWKVEALRKEWFEVESLLS